MEMNLRRKVLGIMLAFVLAITGFGLVGCGGGGTNNQVIDNGDQEQEQEQQETTYNYEFTTKYSIDGDDWKYLETNMGEKKVGYNTFGVNSETNASNVVNPLEDLVFADVADVTDADQLVVEFKITNNSENELYYLVNLINGNINMEYDAETGDSYTVIEYFNPYALYYVGTEEKDVQDLNEMYDDEEWGWRYEQDDEEGLQLVSDGLFDLREVWECLDYYFCKELIRSGLVEQTSDYSFASIIFDTQTTIEGFSCDEDDDGNPLKGKTFSIPAGQSKYFYVMINADEQDEEALSELLDILTEDGFSGLFTVRLSEDDNISCFTVIDGIVYTDDGEGGYVAMGARYSTESILLQQGTTRIADEAFYDCWNITQVVFPNTITEIGECAFAGTGITEVTIPEGVNVGYDAFYSCDDLQTVIIMGESTVSSYVFGSCDSLTRMFISSTVQLQGNLLYSNSEELVIYTDAESKPADWSNNWNLNECPVEWNTSLQDFLLLVISE